MYGFVVRAHADQDHRPAEIAPSQWLTALNGRTLWPWSTDKKIHKSRQELKLRLRSSQIQPDQQSDETGTSITATMSQERPRLFGRTRYLIGQVDDFLDKLAEGSVLFERGLLSLIDDGVNEGTEKKAEQLKALKERCKELRRNVVNTLVSEMLIPDFRGDVLSLLSNLFRLLDVMGRTYVEFLIEHQSIRETASVSTSDINPDELRRQYKELFSVVVKSVLATVSAARAFFRNPSAVHDHINEIRIYENEADIIALSLKRSIFSSSLGLDQKRQLRDAIDVIDAIADMAEDLSDDLAVYAIKREL